MNKRLNIQITTEYIKLDQLLKLSGIVGSGSEAKHIIQSENIYLNGERVNQRGKKIRAGDTVKFGEIEINVC